MFTQLIFLQKTECEIRTIFKLKFNLRFLALESPI